MAMGDLSVQLKDPSNGGTIAFGTAHNGTAQITLPDYYPSVSAIVEDYNNDFYTDQVVQEQQNMIWHRC